MHPQLRSEISQGGALAGGVHAAHVLDGEVRHGYGLFDGVESEVCFGGARFVDAAP
ncbi:hypothetical protein RMN57_01085 [Kitasatospora sp. CM 4170]|uniref:Uncharacterized protein n=1 Tax=Kitasatospora aburaviensis TaxID=67265 RepID=A0ABW1F6Q7_9ACTN|nr:hypothetical protein [Kitasatospora sp. CM 4170]WNM43396.1 hypothetical protein RMN57_01085 [Kitasatospora sp. CM 4170]